MEPILRMVKVTKRFPGVLANDRVNLDIHAGEIHALLGENGAGKTTLMNILYGLYRADEGEVTCYGRPVRFNSAKDAIKTGIGMIHQHFMLIPVHSVVENIVMGMKTGPGILLHLKKAEQEIRALSRRYGLEVDPQAKVWELSVGAQQRVEIIKALYRKVQILIMDEPTAVLTPQEVEELFVILQDLAREGMSIILITHKLSEVMSVSDRVTVLRDGKVVSTVKTSETNEKELARLMVGRDVSFIPNKTKVEPGPVRFELRNVGTRNRRKVPVLRDVSLTVRAGEIVGVAGVDGNGQSELAEVITGLYPLEAGEVLLDGQRISGLSPRGITERGVAHIPEDRHRRGLVLEFTVAENCILKDFFRAPYVRRGFLDRRRIEEQARGLIERFGIRTPGTNTPVSNLSGGNQQKTVVARELSRNPRLLIAMQPTRGVDVGSIENIHAQILRERELGAAILLISTELSEILALSDRILVMYKGEIKGELPGDRAEAHELGMMMAGYRQATSISGEEANDGSSEV